MALVSPGLRAFIEDHIDNFEQVEVLARLWSDGTPTSARQLAELLQMEERSAANALEQLGRLRLVKPVTGGYTAASGPHDALVDELVRLHQGNRRVLIELLAELALARLRLGGIRAFADAFKWRGKK
jgi:hypothetical protein